MSTATNLFKSSVTRTSFTILQIGVGFFMMPFLVSKLGDQWYGIWTVVGSLTAYFYLADFGLTTAVIRNVAKFLARKNHTAVNIVVNTTLVIYSVLGLVILLLTLFMTYFAYYFIPNAQTLSLVRLTILILGVNLAIEFPYKAFAGIISAYLRYDLLTYVHLFTFIIATTCTVLFLSTGYGIVALALIGFFSAQVSNVLFFLISKYLHPDMVISLRYFVRNEIRGLFTYGIWSFVVQISDQVRFRIDSLVIAWVLGATYVTHYFIGARLAEYFIDLIFRATNILMPIFTKYYEENNYEEIRSRLLFFTKINAIASVFGGGLIIIVGVPFISRWMGINYLDAYPVLAVLVAGRIAEAIYNPAGIVMYAIAKHPRMALVNTVEGIANLCLSIVLVHYWGILGVALGTTIPQLVARLYVLPLYTCGLINLTLKKYYFNILPTIFFTVIYELVFYILTKNMLNIPQYINIVFVCLSAIPIYFSAILFVAFSKSERVLIRSMIPLKRFQNANEN
jgi:O-antigen/teichoic acid export membrane protein